MEQIHFSCESHSDGLALSATLFLPSKPRALVQIVHGMQEHKERYYPFMEALGAAGYASVIADTRGHGASVKNSHDLSFMYDKTGTWAVEDVDDVRKATLAQMERGGVAQNLPYFVFAHSMGTLIARTFLKAHDALLSGLVLSGAPGKNPATSAGLALISVLSALKGERKTSKLCDALVFGSANKNLPGTHRLRWLSANTDNVDAYEADELCGVPFTLNGYKNLLKLLKSTYSADGWLLNNPKLPILFIAGADDPITLGSKSFQESQGHLRNMGYQNVQGKEYPGLRHELLQEHSAEQITQDVIAFFNSVLSEQPA